MSAAQVIRDELGTVAGFSTGQSWADRVLAALKRHGYAVVELPKPTREGDGDAEEPRASWTFGDWDRNLIEAWDDGSHLHVKAADFSWGQDMSVRDARMFAAALLAAADAAEVTP